LGETVKYALLHRDRVERVVEAGSVEEALRLIGVRTIDGWVEVEGLDSVWPGMGEGVKVLVPAFDAADGGGDTVAKILASIVSGQFYVALGSVEPAMSLLSNVLNAVVPAMRELCSDVSGVCVELAESDTLFLVARRGQSVAAIPVSSYIAPLAYALESGGLIEEAMRIVEEVPELRWLRELLGAVIHIGSRLRRYLARLYTIVHIADSTYLCGRVVCVEISVGSGVEVSRRVLGAAVASDGLAARAVVAEAQEVEEALNSVGLTLFGAEVIAEWEKMVRRIVTAAIDAGRRYIEELDSALASIVQRV